MAEAGRAESIAFAGPCLAGEPLVAPRLVAGVELWPPARRGDVLRALGRRPAALLLLDGYYYSQPAVTHKELLYALEAGVRVVGAASMGALRAAEMAPCGMEGVGRVFELFRDGVLEGDDEVAILHAPAELGYRPLTVALVELRWALEALVAEGRLTAAAAAALVAAAQALPFVERRPEVVLAAARERCGEAVAAELMARLERPGVKRRDAETALARLQRREPDRGLRPPHPSPPVTAFLSHFREWTLGPTATADGAPPPTYRQAWNVVQLFHPGTAAFVRGLRCRFLHAAAALAAGLEPAAERVAEVAEQLRRGATATRLPDREWHDEARQQALAEALEGVPGGAAVACRRLAEGLGLSGPDPLATLLALVAGQDDLLPAWSLLRAFLATAVVEPALATAGAALEVHSAYRRWSAGRRIAEDGLTALAAAWWGVAEEAVPGAAAARGLFPSHGFAAGLRDALELVAAAERLPVPVNGYPRAKARLLATPLVYPLPLPAGDPDAVRPACTR